MTAHLTPNADQIFVEWATIGGGCGVVAFIDEKSQPFIGLYTLNCLGKPEGIPCWFPRERLITDFVIGFREHKPLIIYIDVEVNAQGISLILHVPLSVAPHRYERHLSARWGSAPPPYGFLPFLIMAATSVNVPGHEVSL